MPWVAAAFTITVAAAVAARALGASPLATFFGWLAGAAFVVAGLVVASALRAAERDRDAANVELAEHEARLAALRARLEELMRAQGRFVGNIAHELKTPLTVVLSQLDLLLVDGAEPALMRRYARSIRDDVHHVSDLVNSFMRLARPFAQADTSHHVPVFVHDVVVEAVRRGQSLANDAGVTVVTTLAELGNVDDVLEVTGDPVLLVAMVENLVRNAVRFSPRNGKVEVEVEVGAAAGNGDRAETITLRVRDHGVGIAAEHLTSVFDWFFDRPAQERRSTGTGFGLAIVRRVAEHHGGTIGVRNLPAGGCEFEVTLPRAAAAVHRPSG